MFRYSMNEHAANDTGPHHSHGGGDFLGVTRHGLLHHVRHLHAGAYARPLFGST